MPSESMVYHPQAAALLQSYQDAYAVLKKPRKLLPACSLGQVEVELDFADGTTRSFAVSPMQVHFIVIIFLFCFCLSCASCCEDMYISMYEYVCMYVCMYVCVYICM